MLRKLASSSARGLLYHKPTAKLSEFKEYACLIESLNEEASSRAIKDHQQLAQKYNLSREDLSYLFEVINSEPEVLKQYVPTDAWRKQVELLNYRWRRSNFYVGGQTLQTTIQQLKKKYPDIANYDTRHPERVKAYKTLESIFLRDGPQGQNLQDNTAVSRFSHEFDKRINGHIAELKKNLPNKTVDPQGAHGRAVGVQEVDVLPEIVDCLQRVKEKLHMSPAYVYGTIRHFLYVHKQQLGEIQPLQTAKTVDRRSLEEGAVATVAGTEVVDSLEDGNDLPLILEEQNKALNESLNYNFLPWINDRKLVFEAQADRGNTLLYGTLGTLLSAYLVYKLYQGDAKNTSLVALFAASAFCIRRYKVNSLRNSFDYLVQLNVHRDGRNLDLYIQKPSNQITKIEGVPISDFKVHRSDYSFDLPENDVSSTIDAALETTQRVRLSDFRKLGVGRTSWVATYGQDVVFVPTQYKGNVSIVNSLLKGKELELGL